ncbi:hypothetical protein CVT24_013216 [Panaeolus cyanescens]|uniref:NAD(P)-binding protein n=1 Tax=Panaeolus cyanescens TaxID=181874 RepID=A0A409YMS9_9AGAR|nr:hypothetical protein CVT24_013216 [Panaeolus cyanescens]
MPSLERTKSDNAAFNPSFTPVVVITGATSGIGRALTQLFAKYLRGRAHIVLVGRNEAAAEDIIKTLHPHPSNNEDAEVKYTYEFIKCDLTLMKNAASLASTLLSKLPKINYLVHSAGVFGFLGREETEEGIDKKLASRYYARFRLTYDLMPLLKKAKAKGESANVLSILGAGQGWGQVDVEDLGLKKGYSGLKAMTESISYNDLMVAEFARRNESIAFTHIYPGFVNTNMGMSGSYNPLVYPVAKIIGFFMQPLLWMVTTSPDVCAEYMFHALVYGRPGVNRRDQYGDEIGVYAFPAQSGAQEKLWEHSIAETRVGI